MGYRIVVYSFQAKKPSGHQTNLRYAGTTAQSACNDALGMYFKCILFMIIQDVLLASALLVLQWTSHFFEVVVVALTCNEYLSLPKKKILKTLLPCLAQAPPVPYSLGCSPAPCPHAQGGVGLVEVPTQIQALQAKVVSRLMEPERLAWKVFQLHHLSNAPHTRALAYGATILFSTVSIGCMQLPARLKGYVTAFKALQPHRLHQVNDMPAEDILNEPLFFNQQIF